MVAGIGFGVCWRFVYLLDSGRTSSVLMFLRKKNNESKKKKKKMDIIKLDLRFVFYFFSFLV